MVSYCSRIGIVNVPLLPLFPLPPSPSSLIKIMEKYNYQGGRPVEPSDLDRPEKNINS
jgi:hypothetical protein